MFSVGNVCLADITINVLAVNGTENKQEKDIHTVLPKELTSDDIFDTDGLDLNYSIDSQSYVVTGKVELGPKETRTYRIRARDLWQIESEQISDIKEQIDQSIERIKDSEYYSTALIKKENLIQRLDYIVDEQKRLADNVESRINSFRVYADEIQELRSDAISVHFWRTKPPEKTTENIITFVIDTSNNTSKEKTINHEHYLPVEVKPEHIVEAQEFQYRYDVVKKQPYLVKEEKLQANESKKYLISVYNVWHIPQKDIEDLRDRTRNAYTLLEKTIYGESAGYLVASIKKNLDKVDESQLEKRSINEHISAFRVNTKRYKQAEKDVEALEDLLEAVREELERSKVKNVLKKVKDLNSIQKISEALFKKPEINMFWKIVIGICITVALFTMYHFGLWGKRSAAIKEEDLENKDSKEEKKD